MEIIYLSGYTEEEKLGIAKKYLLPKQLEEHGLTSKIVNILDEGLKVLISHYTREARVRNLEREYNLAERFCCTEGKTTI
jgi:ATP-dependent Lon protease